MLEADTKGKTFKFAPRAKLALVVTIRATRTAPPIRHEAMETQPEVIRAI